ncbi:TPA: hypothetical protein ACTY9I_005587, partial [Raoultella planticola]
RCRRWRQSGWCGSLLVNKTRSRSIAVYLLPEVITSEFICRRVRLFLHYFLLWLLLNSRT